MIVRDESPVGTFLDSQDAAAEAVRRFGRGPYLIRRVGAPPLTLPPSVMYVAAGGAPHTALIGRTFLQNFTLTYEGETGRVTLAT